MAHGTGTDRDRRPRPRQDDTLATGADPVEGLAAGTLLAGGMAATLLAMAVIRAAADRTARSAVVVTRGISGLACACVAAVYPWLPTVCLVAMVTGLLVTTALVEGMGQRRAPRSWSDLT